MGVFDTALKFIRPDQTAASTAAWTSSTGSNTALSLTVTNFGTVVLSLNPTGTITAGGLNFEVSDDSGTTWYAIQGVRLDSSTAETAYTLSGNTTRLWQFDVAGLTTFRVRLNPVITGTGTVNLRVQAQAGVKEPAVTVGQATAANLQMTVGAALPAGTNLVGYVGLQPLASGGLSIYRKLATGTSQDAANIRSIPAQLYGYYIANTSAGWRYVKLYNQTTTPASTDTPVITLAIPAGGAANAGFDNGISFGVGLGIRMTTGVADNDTGNLTANDVVANLFYK